MKAIPYLVIAVGLAILSGAVALLFSTYFELVHPTVVLKRGNELAPANALWFVGSVVNLIGSAILLVSILFSFGAIQVKEDKRTSSTSESEELQSGVLVARPNQPFAVLLQSLLVLVAIYQVPFVTLFLVYREQWNRNWFGSFGSAAILLLVSFFLIRIVLYRMAVGDLHIELDDAQELPPDQLIGRIVLNRQSNKQGVPLVLVLKLYERRDLSTQRGPLGLTDNSNAVNSRELYWQFRFKSKSPIENPFQPETQFPFEMPVPAWLPRPFSRSGVSGTIGMEWQLEVSGRFGGSNVSTSLAIEEIPSRLKQSPEKRIKISQEELANFLAQQSIIWKRSDEPRTMTIVRDRPPFVYTMLFSVVCAMIAIGCAVASIREWNEFALWLLVGSLLMLFASLGQRYIYRVTQIQEQDVLQERRIFGSFSRQKVNRVDLASVSVEPRKVQNDDETPHVEFDIFLLSTGSKETRMHLACIRTRLVAKAFAKAIANELNLPVIYQVSDRSYSTPDAT